VVEKAMNPDFQHFDLPVGTEVSRSDEVVLKVFCDYGDGWILLVEAQLWLGGLKYLGKGLETWREPLPQNCIVLWMSDGCYASFWDMGPEVPPPMEREEKEDVTMVCSTISGDVRGADAFGIDDIFL
jgi:hypothetical protein